MKFSAICVVLAAAMFITAATIASAEIEVWETVGTGSDGTGCFNIVHMRNTANGMKRDLKRECGTTGCWEDSGWYVNVLPLPGEYVQATFSSNGDMVISMRPGLALGGFLSSAGGSQPSCRAIIPDGSSFMIMPAAAVY